MIKSIRIIPTIAPAIVVRWVIFIHDDKTYQTESHSLLLTCFMAVTHILKLYFVTWNFTLNIIIIVSFRRKRSRQNLISIAFLGWVYNPFCIASELFCFVFVSLYETCGYNWIISHLVMKTFKFLSEAVFCYEYYISCVSTLLHLKILRVFIVRVAG